jgi:hypothetical protein
MSRHQLAFVFATNHPPRVDVLNVGDKPECENRIAYIELLLDLEAFEQRWQLVRHGLQTATETLDRIDARVIYAT